MTRRLSTLPLALLLAVPGCDQPHESCDYVPPGAEAAVEAEEEAAEEGAVSLVDMCGFAESYAGEAVQEDGTTTLEVQVLLLGPTWVLGGVIHEEGVEPSPYLISIQPDGCSGEFDGLWGGEGQSAWFEGKLTPEGVEFSRYRHTVSLGHHWTGPDMIPVSIE